MKTFRFIKTLGMALLAICMCVNFTACSDDEEGNSIVAGKTFHASSQSGGGDGDNEHREYMNETLFFGANGVVSYRLQCREVWWGPDSGDGENSWTNNREGTYTTNGDRIIISGISSQHVGDWGWTISGEYMYFGGDQSKLTPLFSNGHTFYE